MRTGAIVKAFRTSAMNPMHEIMQLCLHGASQSAQEKGGAAVWKEFCKKKRARHAFEKGYSVEKSPPAAFDGTRAFLPTGSEPTRGKQASAPPSPVSQEFPGNRGRKLTLLSRGKRAHVFYLLTFEPIEKRRKMVVSEFSWLCRYSRPIFVHGRNVRVLSTPQEFYGALLVSQEQIILPSAVDFLFIHVTERGPDSAETYSPLLSLSGNGKTRAGAGIHKQHTLFNSQLFFYRFSPTGRWTGTCSVG